jgi:hypothetical protein
VLLLLAGAAGGFCWCLGELLAADEESNAPARTQTRDEYKKPAPVPQPVNPPPNQGQGRNRVPRPPRQSSCIEETVEIDAQGDARVTRELQLTQRLYTNFKAAMPNNTALLRRRLGQLGLNQHWYEIDKFKARFEDEDSTVVLEWTARGLARPRPDQLWEAPLAEEGNLKLTPVHAREVLLTGQLPTERWGNLLLTRRVRLPKGGKDLQLLAAPARLGFRLPPPTPPANGTPGARFAVEARRHLMACLAQVYGQPRFPERWMARAVFENTTGHPLRDYRVRFRLVGYSIDWSEHTCPLVVPGQTVVDAYFPTLDLVKLAGLAAPAQAQFEAEYQYRRPDDTVVRATERRPVQVLSRNLALFSSLRPEELVDPFYDGCNNMPLVLAAMVTKDDPVIGELAGRVSKLAGGADASGKDHDAIKYMETLYRFMGTYIAYQTSPVELFNGKFTQHIKYGRDVLRNKAGTCVDLAILYASACEAVGLEPVLFGVPGHCFPAIRLPRSQSLVGVETTLIGKRSFEEANKRGVAEINQARQGPHYAVNILEWRCQGVRCLPLQPANLSLKDLSFPDNDQLVAQRPAVPQAQPIPQAQPAQMPAPAPSLAGQWYFIGMTSDGIFAECYLTLGSDGRYTTVLTVMGFNLNGRLVSNVIRSAGTYQVGNQTIVFNSTRGQSVCGYALAAGLLTVTVPDRRLGQIQLTFLRIGSA